MKTRIIRHEKTTGLFIDTPSLLDSMDESDRKEFVAFACEDEVFVESVLRSVATADDAVGIERTGSVDCWFGSATKTRLRLALAPIMEKAAAEELTNAVAKAEKYERAHRHLESLAHFDMLRRTASDPDERNERSRQWISGYDQALAMFPQYQEKR